MIPQQQTRFVDKEKGIRGNCMVACYASYFDLQVEDCPQFQLLFDCTEPNSFWDDVVELWLKQKGVERDRYPAEVDPYSVGVSDYYFAWGPSVRGVYHQVIFKNGKLFHDPHPSNAGLITVSGYEVLTPVNR